MLTAMSWRPGTGLGTRGQGGTEPVALEPREGRGGIGIKTKKKRDKRDEREDEAGEEGKRRSRTKRARPPPTDTQIRHLLRTDLDDASEELLSRHCR